MSQNEEKLKQAIQDAEATKEQLGQFMQEKRPLHQLPFFLVKFGIICFFKNVKLKYYSQKLSKERRIENA